MITKLIKITRTRLVGCATCAALATFHFSLFTSCSDMLYDESDQVIYADDHSLSSDADTLWSVAGIMNKMQVIADRTILLGELRGDLVDVTSHASSDLRDMAFFSMSEGNKYNSPRDYYAIINNCNYFIANADTALRDNRNDYIFMKEYAAVKAFRAWTYLQLVLNYGSVPFIVEPILTKEQSEQDFPRYDIPRVCQYFISDIAPYADIELPSYQSIRSTDSRLFYFPINLLLGDLYLWAGQYREAAQCYYRYLSTRNGTNSAYTISTNAVRFRNNDSRWMSTTDSWAYMFSNESVTANSELITMIPGDSIPSEGNYSELRDLFNTTENNEYRASIVPSQSMRNISLAQKYCQFTTGGEYILAPDGIDEEYKGDLRLRSAYTLTKNSNLHLPNGRRIESYSTFAKYSTRNVHLYRRAIVYLRLAEALNRAGFPRFAFQILKQGVNNNVILNEVIPYYDKSDSLWLSSFNFPNTSYILETSAGLSTENTMGLHSRGSGYTDHNDTYVLPDDTTITDAALRLQYQIEHVEDLIIDEEALELAFEGHRYYDLMRVALRRNDPSYLARRIYQRRGAEEEATMRSLIKADLNDPNNWYMDIEH